LDSASLQTLRVTPRNWQQRAYHKGYREGQYATQGRTASRAVDRHDEFEPSGRGEAAIEMLSHKRTLVDSKPGRNLPAQDRAGEISDNSGQNGTLDRNSLGVAPKSDSPSD